MYFEAQLKAEKEVSAAFPQEVEDVGSMPPLRLLKSCKTVSALFLVGALLCVTVEAYRKAAQIHRPKEKVEWQPGISLNPKRKGNKTSSPSLSPRNAPNNGSAKTSSPKTRLSLNNDLLCCP